MRPQSPDDAGADADDEDDAPDVQDCGRQRFITANLSAWTRRDRKVTQKATAWLVPMMTPTATMILHPLPP